jgi:hypothetical protein
MAHRYAISVTTHGEGKQMTSAPPPAAPPPPHPLATTTSSVSRRRPHYIAATFYLVLAVLGIVAAVNGHPSSLVLTAIAGAYSMYLYRGGRFVIWIW